MDGSYNQFLGGGFLQEPSQTAQTATQAPQVFQQSAQTVRCCSVKSILEAYQQSQDDRLYLDGQMLHTVCICGQVRQTSNMQGFFLFTVEDNTGSIQMKLWDPKKGQVIQQNDWIRAFGDVKSPENQQDPPYIMLFKLIKVTDEKEISVHKKRVVYEQLLLSKYAGGCRPINQPSQMATPGMSATPAGNDADLESIVINIIKSKQGGMHLNEVIAQLNGRFQLHQIKSAISQAIMGGKAFSSEDPEWYYAC